MNDENKIIVPTALLLCFLVATLACTSGNTDEQKKSDPDSGLKVIMSEKDTAINTDSGVLIIENNQKDKIVFSVSTTFVSYQPPFGYVTKSSAIYNVTNSEPGYILTATQNGQLVLQTSCAKNQLKKYINRMKYELSVKDSVVSIMVL